MKLLISMGSVLGAYAHHRLLEVRQVLLLRSIMRSRLRLSLAAPSGRQAARHA